VPNGPLQEIVTQNAVRDQGGGRWLLEGSIELRGLAAHQVTPRLQGLTPEEKTRFLSAFLEETFGLNSLSQEAVTAEPDRVTLKYRADFTAQYLKLDKGGFSLEAPTLFGGRSGYTTLDLEGPREFTGLVQNDHWSLPKGFTELEGPGVSNAFAKGGFTQAKSEVMRRYEGLRGQALRGDPALQQFQRDRDRLHKARVWRNP
jgi:hypothetical protein